MPLFITNLIDGQQVPLYKGGEHNVRDWLHAEDHASGVDTALLKGEPGNIYNVAGGNERENIVLTRRLLSLLGRGEEFIKLVPDRPGHDFRYSIDASKLRALGWRPKMDWDAGVAATVEWYKKNEWWWRKIKSGEFLAYYKKQYEDRK
jgi:dTDP-glucose 4,6-dehydratase